MPLGDKFCMSRKDRTGGGVWMHLKGGTYMAVAGLDFKKPWSGHFSPFVHDWA